MIWLMCPIEPTWELCSLQASSMASGVVEIVSGWAGSAVCMLGREH